MQFCKTVIHIIIPVVLCSATVLNVNGQQKINAEQSTTSPVTINLDAYGQRIEHFGASDAWACQFVGQWQSNAKEEIADLLFSTDTTSDGRPRGIGLSMWRFNIGAGSAETGGQSGINDEWRRAASPLHYTDALKGQYWFLSAAKKRGVPNFLAFANSPPVQLTINGKAFATGGKSNLAPGKYVDFATYLVSAIKIVQKNTGVKFNYISPVNEPQWDWSDGGQEGTPFFNNEIFGLVKELDKAIVSQKLPVKIIVPEAGQIDYLYTESNKPGRGNQIRTFFNCLSAYDLSVFPSVAKVTAGHSYFTTSPDSVAKAKRRQLAATVANEPGLRYWMSEYCILGDNAGDINGSETDLGMNAALYTARVIHNDIMFAGASAWHWWLAISPYNYKDGLIYIDKNKPGTYKVSKMLWALGNYSRFIRPGYVRVDNSLPDAASQLLISSYKDAAGKTLVIVVINTGQQTNLKLNIKNGRVNRLQPYITSETQNLEPGNTVLLNNIPVETHSITTFIGAIE